MRRLVLIITALLAVISLILYFPRAPEILPPTQQFMSPFPLQTTALSITDPHSHVHYFYHSHRGNEHGHFHLFVSDADQSIHAHVMGIALDSNRMPISLFVTAPWVTGEEVLPADTVINSFSLSPDTVENQWMLKLFSTYRDEILQLLHKRDNYQPPFFGRHEVIAEIKIQQFPHGQSAEIDQME